MSHPLPHEYDLRQAIKLGQQNLRLPFGALIVAQLFGTILADSWNRTEMSPIWHGGIDAINRLVEVVSSGAGPQKFLAALPGSSGPLGGSVWESNPPGAALTTPHRF